MTTTRYLIAGLFAVAGCSSATLPAAPTAQAETAAPAAGDAVERLCPTGRFRCLSFRHLDKDGRPPQGLTPYQSGLGATDLQKAYGLDAMHDPPANTLVATTIAFGYPNAEQHLATYRQQYGLPECTKANGCLKIVNQKGEESPLPAAGTGDNAGWQSEAALDLDMISAGCPKCKILLVLTDDSDNGLMLSQEVAAKLGASVISDSWGGVETDKDKATDSDKYFQISTSAAIFAASGDGGYNNTGHHGSNDEGPLVPSVMSRVIGVGGTVLSKSSSSSRGWSESAWSSAGSSCSISIAKPSWQGDETTCKMRAAADVAAAADQIAIYDGKWSTVGGTSASSPFVAGVFALYGHVNTTGAFVNANKTAFNDVTSGSNGSCMGALCNAGPGWDGPTGWGTPNGDALSKITPTPPSGGADMAGTGTGTDMSGGGQPGADMAAPPPPAMKDMAGVPGPTQPDMATSPPSTGPDMAKKPSPPSTNQNQGGCAFAPAPSASLASLLLLLASAVALGRVRLRRR